MESSEFGISIAKVGRNRSSDPTTKCAENSSADEKSAQERDPGSQYGEKKYISKDLGRGCCSEIFEAWAIWLYTDINDAQNR